MRYVIEVMTETRLSRTPEWVHLASHDGSRPAVAAAVYEASKHRYPRVRLRRENGRVIVDSALPSTASVPTEMAALAQRVGRVS